MGLDSLLQQNIQNAGLAGTDRLARNAMFPQSQMDKTQYAVSSQMPTSAETIRADYDTPSNSYTGLPTQNFATGGIASIPRYDGEDGSVVTDAPVEEVKPPTMAELAQQLNEAYRTNANYDQIWEDFAATKEQDPQEWYRKQLEFLGGQEGWQIGQNTSERNAALQPQIQDTVAQAKAAGLGDEEIAQIMARSNQVANYTNQRRIAEEAANAGSGIGGAVMPMATIAAMALAPELAPFLAPELGAFGGAMASGALTGGALGGLGAGMTGGDIGKGVLMGGATGAAGAGLTSGLNSINPNLAQGINTAKNVYSVAESGGKNPIAGINAFRGIASMAPTTAAQGGLMGGGISTLGSYSDGGRLLKGPGDGMSDNIPAKIGQSQPARLADGEFVVPADVVSHLGNGSTDAGAKQLYAMMDKIRKARTGTKKQGKQINPAKFLP